MLEAAKALQREAQRAADDVSNLAARFVTVPPLQVPGLPGPDTCSCCMGRDGYQQHIAQFRHSLQLEGPTAIDPDRQCHIIIAVEGSRIPCSC